MEPSLSTSHSWKKRFTCDERCPVVLADRSRSARACVPARVKAVRRAGMGRKREVPCLQRTRTVVDHSGWPRTETLHRPIVRGSHLCAQRAVALFSVINKIQHTKFKCSTWSQCGQWPIDSEEEQKMPARPPAQR
eukprot:6177751-Pleurochrysis_carterae.AAC.1